MMTSQVVRFESGLKKEAARVQEELDENTRMATAEKMSLEEQLTNLGSKFKLKEKQLEISESEKQNIQDQLHRTQEQFNAVNVEMAEVKQRLEASLTDTQNLHDQILEKTAQVQQYSKQSESFKTQLEDTSDTLYTTQQELLRYQQEYQRSEQEVQRSQQEVLRLQELVKTMEDDTQIKVEFVVYIFFHPKTLCAIYYYSNNYYYSLFLS